MVVLGEFFLGVGAVICLGGFAGMVQGETITVTTEADAVDFSSPQTTAQLPGPDERVSFREAVIAANNTAGPQTITFAIPQSEFTTIA
jgi:hypothetical protein